MDTYNEFSPLDHIFPPLYHAFILAFESNSDDDQFFSILKTGLLKLAEQHPSLAKEIERDNSNHLVFSQSVYEIPLIRNDLTKPTSEWTTSYEQLKQSGMVFTSLDARILAPLTATVGTTHPMSAQVNFIPGGKLLSVCFSHSFVDGHGASVIIGLWAKLCRDLQQTPASKIQASGTHGGENPLIALAEKTDANYDTLKMRSELWELLCLDSKRSGGPQMQDLLQPTIDLAVSSAPSKITSKIFSFSETALRTLKEKASPTAASIAGEAWISTHDALLAFLWRHILRSRFPVGEYQATGVKSEINVAVNARKTLSISDSHIGDVVFASVSSLPLQDLLSAKTLGQLAQTVRKNVNRTKNPSTLTEALALACCIPGDILLSLRSCFDDMFGENLATSSWADLPFYEMDWGVAFGHGGRIDCFRIVEGLFAGVMWVQPRKRDGTVEVLLSSKEEQMERLVVDKEFLEVAQLVG